MRSESQSALKIFRRMGLPFWKSREPGFSKSSKRNSGLIPVHILLSLLLIFPQTVLALPEGGQIAAGQGTINQPTPQDLVVNQNSNNLIVDWQGFNIGGAESVEFVQPGVDSVALNRVIGADPSIILGRLSANGQIFISNPSGVIFGPGSQVDVHGLLATTLGISNQDFLNRNYKFQQDPDSDLSFILNEGAINASYVGLLAPSIINRGSIVANLGSVSLGSGKAATLDFVGNNLINFAITDEVAGTAKDSQGNVIENNINNEGLIRADGGQVTLSVRRAGEIIHSVVNQQGVIEARSVVEKDGKIFLSGGDAGVVNVAGTLDASGLEDGETGGTIHVTGEKVGLVENAKLDASGDAGGGEILVGGEYQGGEGLDTASRTYVGENALILADAVTSGDGGKVITWADEITRFYGSISTTGGELQGDGGFVEVSGKEDLIFRGAVDNSSVNGNAGAILFDPKKITVGINVEPPGIPTNDQFAENPAGEVTFDASQLAGLLSQGAPLALQANTDIIIDQAITVNEGGGGGNLTLQAGRSILINADIFTDNGSFFAGANTGTDLGVIDAQRDPGAAVIQMADGTTIDAGTGNVILIISPGTGLTDSTSGNIVVENIIANDALIFNAGNTPGSSILRASADSLITANSVALDLFTAGGGGTIGTLIEPLRVTVNNLDAHTDFVSPGIFIDSPTQGLNIGGSPLAQIPGLATFVTGDIKVDRGGTDHHLRYCQFQWQSGDQRYRRNHFQRQRDLKWRHHF